MSQGDNRINPGAWLIDHLESVSRGSRGEITIGGMITIIAIALGFDVAGLQAVPGETRITLRSFISMHWLEDLGPGSGYLWKTGNNDYAILPDPNNTAIYEPENWLFQPDFPWAPGDNDQVDHMEEDEPPQQQPQQQPHQQPQPHEAGGGFQRGLEDRMAALEAGFGQLRMDVGAMTTAFGNMSTEFGMLRDDLRHYYYGSSSSQPGSDPSQGQ